MRKRGLVTASLIGMFALAGCWSGGDSGWVMEGGPQNGVESGTGAGAMTWEEEVEAGIMPACLENPMGTIADFNVLVFGDMTQSYTDVEGRVAVGGNATLNGFYAGALLPYDITRFDLIVGGNLVFENGAVRNGAIIYAGSGSIAENVTSDRIIQGTVPVDFTATGSILVEMSQQLGLLPVNGSTTIGESDGVRHAITLVGSNVVNVFSVNGADLANAYQLAIQAPENASVLVNVRGPGPFNFVNMGTFLTGGITADHVMFNFPDAVPPMNGQPGSAMRIESVQFLGSILAPNVSVSFPQGLLIGQMFAASLEGGGQTNLMLFDACLPIPPCIPACEVGYQCLSRECVDVDECLAGTDNCLDTETCNNIDGSFVCCDTVSEVFDTESEVCECATGFQADAPGTCVDIDECTVGSDTCLEGETCNNTVGSFVCCDTATEVFDGGTEACICADGYELNVESVCVDIDECANDTDGCAQNCQNTIGSHTCSCNGGYVLNADGHACDDIDECATAGWCSQGEENPLQTDAVCQNTVGGFTCECVLPYSSSSAEEVHDCVGHAMQVTTVESDGDTVVGWGSGADTIYGYDGNDSIDGGGANDYIDGGTGNDSLLGGAGNDEVRGGLGNDTVAGGSSDDMLYGEAGDDTLIGNIGTNSSTGGNDKMYGGDGADSLFAEGSAILEGNGGGDIFAPWYLSGASSSLTFYVKDFSLADGDHVAQKGRTGSWRLYNDPCSTSSISQCGGPACRVTFKDSSDRFHIYLCGVSRNDAQEACYQALTL